MVSVYSQIEIAAPPATVKNVFFDWPEFPNWAKTQLQNVQHAIPKQNLELGDKIKVTVKGMTFSANVSDLSEEVFQWDGGISYLVYCAHTFRFEPSKITPGGTTFTNSEEFTGVLAAPFKYAGLGGKKDGPSHFDGFNQDLKRKVESLV